MSGLMTRENSYRKQIPDHAKKKNFFCQLQVDCR